MHTTTSITPLASTTTLFRIKPLTHDGGEGGRWKREKERRSGKARVVDQTADMTERASTLLSIRLSEETSS
jgi:hypothetical protein